MSRMSEILGERACPSHPDTPAPCCECSGVALSNRDVSRGGFKGTVSKFEDDQAATRQREQTESSTERAAVAATLGRWGVKKQLGDAAFA